MRILLVTETLHAGGAETFVVRLANALAEHHEVGVINLHPDKSKQALVDQLNKKINLINISMPFKRLIGKADGALRLVGFNIQFSEHSIIGKIGFAARAFKPDVIHSHLFKTDYYVSVFNATQKQRIKHISTNHGDYLLYETKSPVAFPDYRKRLKFTLCALDHMVTISDKQIHWLQGQMNANSCDLKFSKILNGYALPQPGNDPFQCKLKPENEFVFGMVARGIKEKGWEQVIRAFDRLMIPNKRLVFVGDGPELDKLRMSYQESKKIDFVGYKPDPLIYIQAFTVCVFASYYQAESLPTVIIEYLLSNKPILATDVGEVREMLTTDKGIAGLLIDVNSEGPDEEQLYAAMQTLHDNVALRDGLIQLTESASKKFEMIRCVSSYEQIYSSVSLDN